MTLHRAQTHLLLEISRSELLWKCSPHQEARKQIRVLSAAAVSDLTCLTHVLGSLTAVRELSRPGNSTLISDTTAGASMPAEGHQKWDCFLSSTSQEEAMTPPHAVPASLPMPHKAPNPPGALGGEPAGQGAPGGLCPSVCLCVSVCPCARPQPPLGTHRLLDDARDDGVGQVQVLRSLRHPGTPCKARTASRGGAGSGARGTARPGPSRPQPDPGPVPLPVPLPGPAPRCRSPPPRPGVPRAPPFPSRPAPRPPLPGDEEAPEGRGGRGLRGP